MNYTLLFSRLFFVFCVAWLSLAICLSEESLPAKFVFMGLLSLVIALLLWAIDNDEPGQKHYNPITCKLCNNPRYLYDVELKDGKILKGVCHDCGHSKRWE